MDTFDWIAILGAAAWLPQIGVLIYRVVTKPKVVMIPVRELELGYTYFGPILNLQASLFAEKKDAIILNMRLTLRHEAGREFELTWQSFVEEFSQLRDASGESAKFTRDQMATALRVSTAVPVDKLIRFQDPSFKAETIELGSAAHEELERMKSSGAEDPVQEFLNSKEHQVLLSQFRKGFPWSAGRYRVQLNIGIQGRKKPAVVESTFDLSQSDVDRLRKNIEVVQNQVELVARDEEIQEAGVYNWINPQLDGKDVMTRK